LNSGGDFYAIQSNNNIRISKTGGDPLTKLILGAELISASGDLTFGGIITGDGSGLSGTANSLNVNTADFWDSYDTPDGWDTDASDDLTTSTQFVGDVDGIYNNLQLNLGVVGESEIDFGEVTLQDFINDGDDGGAPFITNPNDNVDSNELSDGLCNTDGSLLKKVDGTWVCYTEADPVFSLWDKSDGVLVTESQITDLNHFTTGDEIDPQVGSTTSDKICYGTGTVIECDRDILITASNEIQFGSGGPKIYVDGNELIIDIG